MILGMRQHLGMREGVICMRKIFLLCAAFFCLSLTASAQDSTGAFDPSSSEAEPASPSPLLHAERLQWQLGAGFQYSHFSVLGQSFSNLGYQASITRYFTNSIGLEGATMEGFGHNGSNSSQVAKSLFLGGGPHISLHNAPRYETWVHALFGLERLRFTQAGVLGSNAGYGFVLGGGVDYKIGEGRLHWRAQGDFIGANIGSAISKNFSFGTGLVLNF